MAARPPGTLWFDGVTRNGVMLIAIACLANTLRRFSGMGVPDLLPATVYFVKDFVCVGVTILAAVATLNRVPAAPRWRYPALALAIVSSCIALVVLANLIQRGGWSSLRESFAENGGFGWWLYSVLLAYGVFAMLAAVVFVFYRLREEHEAATREAELDRARSEHQMDEARLQTLQAQIEPHFLFNTLANVRRLYQTAPVAADEMLGNLTRYLAIALPQMRATTSTLGREAGLTEAYLRIQQMRMGPRLGIELDIPPLLAGAPMPPMMLVTLAENAIKHGVGPLPEGGRVQVSARLHDGELCLQVSDTGQGFTRTSGGGTGLANIRARLAGLYGNAARFTLAHNKPRGVIATIAVPYRRDAAGA